MGKVRVDRLHVEPYLRALSPSERRRLRKALQALAGEPRPEGLDIKLLETDPDGVRFYRIRIGPHRIVYSVRGQDVFVHRAFHRQEGYGWLERA